MNAPQTKVAVSTIALTHPARSYVRVMMDIISMQTKSPARVRTLQPCLSRLFVLPFLYLKVSQLESHVLPIAAVCLKRESDCQSLFVWKEVGREVTVNSVLL